MIDPASIGSAYEAVKAAKDVATWLLGSKIDAEVKARVQESLNKLGEAQDHLFQLRANLFELQEENERLKRELSQQEAFEKRKGEYKLSQTIGGAVVYAYLGEPQHYVCPSCFGDGQFHILQDKRLMVGTFECPKCKSDFPVNQKNIPQGRVAHRGFRNE